MHRTIAVACSALALGAVALAGCGGADERSDSPATTRGAAAATGGATCPNRESNTLVMAFTNRTDEMITVRAEPGWSCANFSETGTPAKIDMLQIPPRGLRHPAPRLEHRSWSSFSDNTRLFGLSFYSGQSSPQVIPIDGQPGLGVWVTYPMPRKYGIAGGMGMPTPDQRGEGVLSGTLPNGTPVTISWFTATSSSPWQGIGITIKPR
jgi:hypothetical protein